MIRYNTKYNRFISSNQCVVGLSTRDSLTKRPEPIAIMSTTPVRKSMQNVFQVLCPTRNYGLGARVTRKVWAKFPEESYWEITRIHPSPDLKHGKVFGRFTFRGKHPLD